MKEFCVCRPVRPKMLKHTSAVIGYLLSIDSFHVQLKAYNSSKALSQIFAILVDLHGLTSRSHEFIDLWKCFQSSHVASVNSITRLI